MTHEEVEQTTQRALAGAEKRYDEAIDLAWDRFVSKKISRTTYDLEVKEARDSYLSEWKKIEAAYHSAMANLWTSENP